MEVMSNEVVSLPDLQELQSLQDRAERFSGMERDNYLLPLSDRSGSSTRSTLCSDSTRRSPDPRHGHGCQPLGDGWRIR